MSKVRELVGDLDVFGLDDREPMTFNVLVSNQLNIDRQAWRFLTNDQKLTEFNKWFQKQIDEDILQVDFQGDPWTAKYVESAYRKGSIRTYTDVHRSELAEASDVFEGSREQFLRQAFAQPERVSKIKFLFTRSLEELRGISAAMAQQVNRVLADGLSQGLGPRTLARRITNTISGINRTRALTLARTEVIAAHAEGQLDSFEDLGVREIQAMVEWSTAGDDRVCPECEALEGTVFTIDEARGLIPRHPNCRCAWIPANVGEKVTRKRFWTKKQKESRIDKSLKARLPKRTRAGEPVPQTVREGKRRSSWLGKELKPKNPPKGVRLNR